jgi:D-sedoheptulose 7-phosphate isomerase
MQNKEIFKKNINENITNIIKLYDPYFETEITILADKCKSVIDTGGTVYLIGNGGSAADAQHIAAEFVVKLKEKRKALPAAALTTDTSILTAIGNDFGFEEIFARQINALCTSKDILIALSTSGTSVNITKAIDEALAIKLPVVLFTSIQAPYISRVHMIRVPGTNSSRIQESYMVLLHTLVEMVENE